MVLNYDKLKLDIKYFVFIQKHPYFFTMAFITMPFKPWCFMSKILLQSDCMEMTGSVSVSIRQKAWVSKRVFFLTPQVKLRANGTDKNFHIFLRLLKK